MITLNSKNTVLCLPSAKVIVNLQNKSTSGDKSLNKARNYHFERVTWRLVEPTKQCPTLRANDSRRNTNCMNSIKQGKHTIDIIELLFIKTALQLAHEYNMDPPGCSRDILSTTIFFSNYLFNFFMFFLVPITYNTSTNYKLLPCNNLTVAINENDDQSQ